VTLDEALKAFVRCVVRKVPSMHLKTSVDPCFFRC